MMGRRPASTAERESGLRMIEVDKDEFLRGILKLGATRDWRVVLQETIGSDISARAMLDYFEPLLEYLRKENEGRRHTLGDV